MTTADPQPNTDFTTGNMLEGIKVIDMTSVVFGPYSSQTLADLGAEVIKVESPGGDAFRHSAKPGKTQGMSPGYMALNRGKSSIVLNLKNSEDLGTMKALLADADVFIHNVRGQAVEKLGLGYEAAKQINPDIIYAHCVGFDQSGPYADLQAYDDVIQAASGTATLLPRVDGNPRPRYFPSLIADKVAGLHGVYAVLAAIIHRLRSGKGQFVEVPMFEAFTHFMMLEHLGGQTFSPPNAPVGYARQLDPDRQPFPTSDGHVSIVAYTVKSWATIFALLDAPDYLEEQGLTDPKEWFANSAQLYQKIAELTQGFTSEEIIERCRLAQIPVQRVNDLANVKDDPQIRKVGLFEEREHPTEGPYLNIRPPVKFGYKSDREVRLPANLDQDRDEILKSVANGKSRQ